MGQRLTVQWESLKRSVPGRRFKDRYERHRKINRGRNVGGRIARGLIAACLIVLGFVFMFIPGPAIVFYLFAGALLATDSRAVAKLLDAAEVKARLGVRWLLRSWKKLPAFGKIAAGIFALGLSSASMLLAYRLVAR